MPTVTAAGIREQDKAQRKAEREKEGYLKGQIMEEDRKVVTNFTALRTGKGFMVGTWRKLIKKGEERCSSCTIPAIETGEHIMFICKKFHKQRRKNHIGCQGWKGLERIWGDVKRRSSVTDFLSSMSFSLPGR